jgi:hypothetical protein
MKKLFLVLLVLGGRFAFAVEVDKAFGEADFQKVAGTWTLNEEFKGPCPATLDIALNDEKATSKSVTLMNDKKEVMDQFLQELGGYHLTFGGYLTEGWRTGVYNTPNGPGKSFELSKSGETNVLGVYTSLATMYTFAVPSFNGPLSLRVYKAKTTTSFFGSKGESLVCSYVKN